MKRLFSPFFALCAVGFFARLSYAMARTPILPLFALTLGAKPEAIGFVVGVSTLIIAGILVLASFVFHLSVHEEKIKRNLNGGVA